MVMQIVTVLTSVLLIQCILQEELEWCKCSECNKDCHAGVGAFFDILSQTDVAVVTEPLLCGSL